MFLIVPPKSVLYEKEITPLSGVLDLFFFLGGGAQLRDGWGPVFLGPVSSGGFRVGDERNGK